MRKGELNIKERMKKEGKRGRKEKKKKEFRERNNEGVMEVKIKK